MNAHLYRIPSDFRNIPDKIIIKANELTEYPGTWGHAVLPLPDGYTVLHTSEDDRDAIVYGTDKFDFSDHVFTDNIRVEGGVTTSDIVFCDKNVKPIYRAKVEWN